VPSAGPLHSTRALLLRVLAAALIAAAAIAADRTLLADPADRTRGARVIEWEATSNRLGGAQPVTIVVPKGARDGKRSLLVFLHGRGEDHKSYLDDEMYDALARQGGIAPLVAFPRGGPDSYWHDRKEGEWGSYVAEDLLPQLVERFDIEPDRVGIGGISMGGFGAIDVARLHPARFCAVGAHSPAVWARAADTAPGAFDDEADFAAHDVLGSVGPPASPLAGKRVWIDVGREDPFAAAAEQLAAALRSGGAEVVFRSWEGGHDSSYWRSHWRGYARFYARSLKRCGEERSGGGDGGGGGPAARSGVGD
jgi:enterochelin esterase-like enzyme